MRHILTSVVLVVLLLPACAPGEVVTMDDLVVREGLYYEKLTTVPFTGEVTGLWQGRIKDGKEDGPWVGYHDNGQLYAEGTFKDGYREGPWVHYWENGQLYAEGTFKDGYREGPWVYYHEDGTVNEERTGTYKNGVKVE